MSKKNPYTQKSIDKEKAKMQYDIEGEIWLPIKDYEYRYLISSKGRYRILEHKTTVGSKIMEITSFGNSKPNTYKKIMLFSEDGKKLCERIHVLVATAFKPNPLNLPQVNHLDGNRHNNDSDNLEWTTCKGNLEHAVKLGLYWHFGSNHHYAKFTEKEVKEIFDSTLTCNVLASKYNVNYNNIWSIKTGRCWTRVTGKKYISKNIANA